MNSDQDHLPSTMFRTLVKRLDFGAAVFAPYFLAIVWQYFCTLNNKSLGWTCAVIVALAGWIFYLWLNDDPSTSSPRNFWLLVTLPLFFFYVIRLPFPDISFDVLNYHVFHSERALRGPLLMAGDYFPTPAPFNPTPDILTGLYRYALGYRLGTIANLLALIWTGTIVERMLRDRIEPSWLRCVATFAVLATEQLLFQINNYMVDLLALPLLLEATRIALRVKDNQQIAKRTILLALLLGTAAAFKLANLIFAAPIAIIFLVNVLFPGGPSQWRSAIWSLAKVVPAASIIFLLPLLPFTILIYRLTGSPVFPLYNSLFKSPFWPQGVLFDPRWGPFGFIETIVWPVMMFFWPERLSEYPFYSGRLSLGLVLAVVLIVFARDRAIRQLAIINIFGLILWSASSGYIRYALYLELTSGITIVWVLSYAWEKWRQSKPPLVTVATAPLALLLLLQISFALAHAYRWEWSARATIFEHRLRYDINEAANLLRDRSLSPYLAPEDARALNNADCWIETTYKTSAIAALLKAEAPAVGVRLDQYFLTPIARRRFDELISVHRGERMFTLTDHENYDKAQEELAARNLKMGSSRPLPIYYFSQSVRFDLILVEVLARDSGAVNAEKGTRLPDNAFSAKLSAVTVPDHMRAGEKYELRIALNNASNVVWPGNQSQWQFQLTVGNRWLRPTGEKVTDVDGRSPLSEELPPGATIDLPLTVTAPSAPGIYILQVDAIQEGVAWFGDRGSEVLTLKIKVE